MGPPPDLPTSGRLIVYQRAMAVLSVHVSVAMAVTDAMQSNRIADTAVLKCIFIAFYGFCLTVF